MIKRKLIFIQNQMNKKEYVDLILVFIVLLAILDNQRFVNADVKVNSISTAIGSIVTPSYGSIAGGTLVYIKGVGFSKLSSQNSVWLGPYPCLLLASGSTQSSLTCQTSPALNTSITKSLQVSVLVSGTTSSTTCSTASCRFSYSSYYTPFVAQITPRTSIGMGLINVWGVHRITNTGDQLSTTQGQIRSLRIGTVTCSLVDVPQEDHLDRDQRDFIACRTFKDQIPGQYNFTQFVDPGYAQFSARTIQTSIFTEKNYTQRVAAAITSMPYHTGGTLGHKIQLTGTGFTSNLSSYICSISGQACSITSAVTTLITVQIPPKSPNNTLLGALLKDPSDTSFQVGSYLGSNGFKYTRYSTAGIYKTTSQWMSYVRTTNNLSVQEDTIKAQIRTSEIYGSDYLEYWRGYFYAPTTGNYTFSGIADDSFRVQISTFANNSNIANLQDLIYDENASSDLFNPYYAVNPTLIGSKILTQGYYYMEIVSYNGDQTGYFRLMVEMPQIHKYSANPTWQVDQLVINPINVVPQMIQVKVSSTANTTYDLKYVVNNGGTYQVYTTSMAKGASASSFLHNLNKLPYYGNLYNPSVYLKTLDSLGLQTSISTSIRTYIYHISYYKYRSPLANIVGSLSSSEATIKTIQQHSNSIKGSYKINVGGQDLMIWSNTNNTYNNPNIPFDTTATQLANAFNHFYGSSEIQVSTIQNVDFDDNIGFVIQYVGLLTPPSVLSLNTSSLRVSIDNKFSTSSLTKRAFSLTRPLYSPLPYDFMRTSQSSPQLYISINKIPVLCFDCSYKFNASKNVILASSSLKDNVMSFGIMDVGMVGFGIGDLVIKFNGVPCNGVQILPMNSLTCSFQKNSLGTAAIPAGNHKPILHVAQVGYADSSAVLSISVDLFVKSISPKSTGQNGGIQGTLVGTGFPIDNSAVLVLKICGNNVTNIISVSNQAIVFTIPKGLISCNARNSYVISSNLTSIISGFTYSPASSPIIFSLSIRSASPILKSNLVISGSGFSILSQTKVFLFDQNGDRIYQLIVLEVTSNTVKCILGGGKAGNYSVVVLDYYNGQTQQDQNSLFAYQIVVQSITPKSGSLGGGYDITITGRNFAPNPSSNTVFIGDAQNMICPVKFANSTQIICTMPRINSNYTADSPVSIVVTGRLVEQSICDGNCNFKYDSAVTNIVDVPKTLTYSAGDTIIINGLGLEKANVTIGNKLIDLITNTSKLLSFNYPALPAGQYEVLIMASSGYSHPSIVTNTNLRIGNSISRNSGSLNGHRISISTNGFPQVVDKQLSVKLICQNYTVFLPLINVVPNLLTFETIKSTNSQSCRLNITYERTYKLFTYTYNDSQTPISIIVASGINTYTLTSTQSVDRAEFIYLTSTNVVTTTIYSANITKITSNTYLIFPTEGYLPNGKFQINVHSTSYGYHTVNPTSFVRNWVVDPTLTATSSSFVGEKSLTLIGSGFITKKIQNNYITVCGLKSKIQSANQSQLTLQIPALITQVTQSLYSLGSPSIITGTLISDNPLTANNVIDGIPSTYYESSNQNCYVGFDFGPNAKANINYIKYMPNPEWAISANYLDGAKFQGSNNGITWNLIFNVDTTQVHSGWNYWPKTNNSNIQYQYIRFSHTNKSQCQISDIQISGIIYSNIQVVDGIDKSCDIVINGVNNVNLSNSVTYMHSKTSTIRRIWPQFGSSSGLTNISLIGTNFGSVLSILIDGIACTNITSTSNQINCLTGIRQKVPSQNSFIVTSDGNPILVICQPYKYIDRWSDTHTWGGQAIPRQGDMVYVPNGMSLMVDVPSTPILNSIIVEGTIIFSDQIDMTLDAYYIIINQGQFVAGTQTNPYQHNLTITLHGQITDKQLPVFGNKVIGCQNCIFNLHGQVRVPTWTQLSETINAGQDTLSTLVAVDWLVGQQIVIASSSFNHYQSQQRTIRSISENKTLITVSEPFLYRHYSSIQTYGSVQFAMRSQVALLTRNIKIQGNNNSIAQEYGAHIMMHGDVQSGLQASFSYAQVTKCGQPKLVGRYCTHFHMAGDVPDSSVVGMAVHHSYARALTIHATNFLLVQKNVGYYVKGHNIFIQDGIQTNNIIQDNLMISSINSQYLLQSDITVASYWINNPFNTVRRNHAAGGDFYGFLYEIKENPDGPSATSDICPTGMQVGESRDNVAHSHVRFGLRIFKLSARKYPCINTRDQSLINPYEANQAILSVFDNYTLWHNAQCGFLGQQLGYTTIKNFKTADNIKGGLQFHKTNLTQEQVTAQNCLIVGYSQNNGPTDINQAYKNTRGFIASRTDGLKASGLSFYNFGKTMTPLQSCSDCNDSKLWVVGSKTTIFQNVTYTNVTGQYIFWENWRREVFVDLDGTLLKPITHLINKTKIADNVSIIVSAQGPGSITPYRPSLLILDHCSTVNNTLWDDSIYCDSTITLRSILFTNAIPYSNFQGIHIKAYLLSDPYDNLEQLNLTDSNFSSQKMIKVSSLSKDIRNSWAMPFANGSYYNIHFQRGIDFSHLAIAASQLWSESQSVILRFNYTASRQIYQIGKWFSKSLQKPFINSQQTIPDIQTCLNGDYYHNITDKYLFVCISGRNKTINQWIDVNALSCLNFCPKDNPNAERQSFFRLWSNQSIWNNGKPNQGDNVTIPYQWNLILDQDVPILNYVQINGNLIFDVTIDHIFQAHYIWVKQGLIRIGSQNRPYQNKAIIVLHGKQNDQYLVLDSSTSGNKMLAVTGQLLFYGKTTDNIWTKSTSIVYPGDTKIKVEDTSGWQVNDTIVIGPTYSGQAQFQQVKITQITGNTIYFAPPLTYEHYGASQAISNSYGVLDTRAAVGLLTRNIKIINADDNWWGCRVLAYSYTQIPKDVMNFVAYVNRTGQIMFDGVQLDGCGQYDATFSALNFNKIGTLQLNYQTPSIISRSSVHNCKGMCMSIQNIKNLQINNSVIFSGYQFLVYAQFANNYTFTNNLLIGARKPNTNNIINDISCYQQYQAIDFTNDNVTVTNNLVQGSQGQGFVFPFAPCDNLSTYNFANNTAGSCEIAFMYQQLKGYGCIGASGMVGYASRIGLMANPATQLNQLIYQNAIFADNQRAITLRYANDIDDNTIIVRHSYFAGFSRPDCPNCYSQYKLSYCRGGLAVQMFAATVSGESFPLQIKNTDFDIIRTRESFDMKSFFNKVTFENYLYTNPLMPYCSKMSVFRRHSGASDATGSAYLTNSPCINCEQDSLGFFQQPNAQWIGQKGGCGTMACTGPNNYIIYDQDGNFTGNKSQILANNSVIGNGQSLCQFNQHMNGYYCLMEDLAVLQFQSIAADYNKRTTWPVTLKYDGSNWTSLTNGWKQWNWDGPKPLNQRLSRFVSVVKLHKTYNLSYSSQPPSDARYQIQKRLLPTGNASDWLIVRIVYNLPNSIQILTKSSAGSDIVVKPYVLKQHIPQNLNLHTNVCGANNFFYKNGTIQFVINGKNDCQVRVRLTNYIQLTARLNIPITDFYTNKGPTKFLTNICAFLGIDTSRLKIVGINTGSTIVQALIQDTAPPLQNSKNPQNIQLIRQDLTTMASLLSEGLTSGVVDPGAPLISVSMQVVIQSDGASSTQQTPYILIIVLCTVIPGLIIIVAVGINCYFRKKKRERTVITRIDSMSHISDSNDKPKRQFITALAFEVPLEIQDMSQMSYITRNE